MKNLNISRAEILKLNNIEMFIKDGERFFVRGELKLIVVKNFVPKLQELESVFGEIKNGKYWN